jgi:N-acetylglucosamine-6-sulfatase
MRVMTVPTRLRLRPVALVLGLAAVQWGLLAAETTRHPARAQTPGSPNIVLILTDDQRYDSLRMMPRVRQLLVERGMTLTSAIVSDPICCPSRATILTGRYAHTTGVYANGPPNGGWSAFKASESDTIATALQDAGYRTGLIGKYLNGYNTATGALYVPPGWDRWFAYASPNPGYYDYAMFDDRLGIVSYGSAPRAYSTDVIRRQATAFIRNAPSDMPLFLMVTPKAPHSPFIAAPRHEGDLDGVSVRLNAAVNEADVSDKPAYIAERGLRNPAMIRQRTRDQWETLLAVDDLVEKIYVALKDTGRVRDTLVLFTSDNGFSNSEHRWPKKQVPYEESIRVPLVVGFPGQVPPGTISNALVSNVDLAPTIADFAGVTLDADGVSLRPLLTDTAPSARDNVILEHLQLRTSVPTYCGVRTSSFTFVHYVTGEEELYDLVQDPHQLRNVAPRRPNRTAQLRALTESLCRPVPPGFSW